MLLFDDSYETACVVDEDVASMPTTGHDPINDFLKEKSFDSAAMIVKEETVARLFFVSRVTSFLSKITINQFSINATHKLADVNM